MSSVPTVTTDELVSAYRTDPDRADREYKGRPIEVVGEILDVQDTFATVGAPGSAVRAMLREDASMQVGDVVGLRCVVRGLSDPAYGWRVVVLDDCIMVR